MVMQRLYRSWTTEHFQ